MKAKSSAALSTVSIHRRSIGLLVLFLLTMSITFSHALNRLVGVAESVLGIPLGRVQRPFVLGLDLQGGTHLEYEAKVTGITETERREALNGVRDVIERRVNAMGVSEPLVQTVQAGDSWRVTVELAGIRDVKEAIKRIGETPILEFKEQSDSAMQTLTDAQRAELNVKNQQARKKAEDALQQAKKPGVDFVALVKQLSENEQTKATQGDLGFLYSNADYRDVFADARNAASGTVLGRVYDRPRFYTVVRVDAVRDNQKEINARHILITYQDAREASTTATKEQARAKIESLKKQATPANFQKLAQEESQEPGASVSGGDLGWSPASNFVSSFEKVIVAQRVGSISDVVETEYGFHIIWKIAERPYRDPRVRAIEIKKTLESDIALPADPWKATKLTGKDLTSARVEFDQRSGAVQISLQLNEQGTSLFAEITKRNVGKPLAIFLDGKPVTDPPPIVREEITGGQAQISGYSLEEARTIARRLQAGALPVPITLIAQQTVGPTLGAESLAQSLRAGIAGFILVAFFMIGLYRIPGVISIIALLLYASLLASLFKLIPVTLTLAGIAGFILSLGIALDANVLIFERLKEEWRAGRPGRQAMEEAFRRAWPSIRDGHITVLISCAVLYGFSSSIIRGFAVTLALGTILSLFTAVVSCRTLMRLCVTQPWFDRVSWWFLRPSHSSESKI